MISRPYSIERIHAAWKKRPIVWLAGVRRAGKTTLARMLPEAVYLNCDLPSVLHRLEDPELFYRSLERSHGRLRRGAPAARPGTGPQDRR